MLVLEIVQTSRYETSQYCTESFEVVDQNGKMVLKKVSGIQTNTIHEGELTNIFFIELALAKCFIKFLLTLEGFSLDA